MNLLSDANRGVYGVFFAAFVVGTTVPHNLIFLPYQVFSVGEPLADRLLYIGRATLMGLAFAAVGGLAVIGAAVVTAHETTIEVTLVLAATAMPTVGVSAAQDNLRRMLHVSERHWSAAAMSVVQFIVVGAVILIMVALDVPVVWMPFGSLLVANIASSSLGLIRAGGLGEWITPPEIHWRTLVARGRWLLGQAIALPGATFVAAAIITAFAGAVAVGYGEASRLVAQPVLVLSTGLTAVLGPRVMAAAIERSDARGLRLIFRHAALVVVAGAGYLVIAGWDVPWNPMDSIIPAAYAVTGLVAVSIVAATASALTHLRVEELMGAHREVDLVKVSLFAGACAVAAAFSTPWTEAFAVPLSLLVMSIARYAGYRFYRRRLYSSESSAPVA